MITKSLETAQGRIEGFNFDSRKQILAYDDVMNTQRLAIYARRRAALLGSDTEIEELILTLLGDGDASRVAFETKKKRTRRQFCSTGAAAPLADCRHVLA